jgi:hypothetical protein
MLGWIPLAGQAIPAAGQAVKDALTARVWAGRHQGQIPGD